jgi:hypothetical protein
VTAQLPDLGWIPDLGAAVQRFPDGTVHVLHAVGPRLDDAEAAATVWYGHTPGVVALVEQLDQLRARLGAVEAENRALRERVAARRHAGLL